MNNWYLLAIITLFCQGIKGFFYKVSAERKYNTALVNFFWATTVVFFSFFALCLKGFDVLDYKLLIIFAFFGGVTYAISSILRVESLKHLDASIAFPLLRFNTVLVIAFSFFYFKDVLTPKQFVGLLVAVLVIFLASKDKASKNLIDKNIKLGFILVFLAVIFGAISSIIPKFASIKFEPLSFMFFTYIFNAFFSLFLIRKMEFQTEKKVFGSFKLGLFMGLFNFVGFYAFLKSLSLGPLSIIFVVQSLAFLISVILAIIFYKEKLTLRRFLGIVLAITAVILMQ